jgi:PAS domain S-box-containing protein
MALVSAVAAVVAGLGCAFAGGRSSGRRRFGWWLLSASAMSWLVAGVAFDTGTAGLAIAAAPLVAGTVVLPLSTGSLSERVRAVIDALLVASLLSLVGWALGLHTLFEEGRIVATSLFLFIAAEALWPFRMRPDAPEIHTYGLLRRFALPYVAAAMAVAINFGFVLSARSPDPVMLGISCTIGALFVLSQVLAMKDSLGWLERSRDAERQLRDRTSLLDEVINRAPLGIARIGDDFRIIDANPRLSEMLATPAPALKGSSIAHFLEADEIARARERMALMRAGKLDRVEVDGEMRSADGRTLFVHRSITPVFNAEHGIHYYLVMFEDITAKHQAEQAALDNLAALERLSRLKSEFMSMVSHEFRTALTGIQGYSEVMTTQEVSTDEVKEFAGDINADAQRLNRMITEMLDLDRIESGRMQLHVEQVDLNRLLCDAVERARMTTRRHDIVTELDPRVGAVQGDRDRLTQVVSNLLTNAVKYSPSGGEIAVASKLQDGNAVEISVRDHGQGIPPEFIQRIFGRYERYESAGVKDTVGTGLGLAIAQQIVQLHKGRIWVESKLGEGSTFRFVIPASESGIKVA